MFNEAYSNLVIEHFMSPRNVGSMPDADAVGKAGDPSCGDSLELYVKIRDNRIIRISFLAFGCAAAIATSSMTTVLAEGQTLDAARCLTDQDIAEALGGLPDEKMHCSVLGAAALQNAIDQCEKNARPAQT